MVSVPRLLVVTDRAQSAGPLVETVAAAVRGGARHVLLREKDLPRRDRLTLARGMRALLEPVGGLLIVAGPDPLGGDAVHLSAADRMPGDRPGLAGRSWHHDDDLGGLSGEDYVTVSPVFASTSKPGYGPALGVDGVRRLCGRTEVPVLALGGVETPARARECLAAGAAGVAVMGAVMRAGDPAGVVAALLAGLGEQLWDKQSGMLVVPHGTVTR